MALSSDSYGNLTGSCSGGSRGIGYIKGGELSGLTVSRLQNFFLILKVKMAHFCALLSVDFKVCRNSL